MPDRHSFPKAKRSARRFPARHAAAGHAICARRRHGGDRRHKRQPRRSERARRHADAFLVEESPDRRASLPRVCTIFGNGPLPEAGVRRASRLAVPEILERCPRKIILRQPIFVFQPDLRLRRRGYFQTAEGIRDFDAKMRFFRAQETGAETKDKKKFSGRAQCGRNRNRGWQDFGDEHGSRRLAGSFPAARRRCGRWPDRIRSRCAQILFFRPRVWF